MRGRELAQADARVVFSADLEGLGLVVHWRGLGSTVPGLEEVDPSSYHFDSSSPFDYQGVLLRSRMQALGR